MTNTRLTHATPGALYSHIANRDYECDSTLTDEEKAAGCVDIARQLVENSPGNQFKVI